MPTNPLASSTSPAAELILNDLQSQYLAALKAGSGRLADQVVQRGLIAHLPVTDIYLDIFQPSAYDVGRLWQHNEFSVAQEHLATAIIERQMGDLHYMFTSPRPRLKTLVIGSVDKEFHRIGARMVADFFEQDGWIVYYLGAAVPTETFVDMAREVNADLIGVSAQMVFNLPAIAEFDQTLESRGMGGLPVIIGGWPFVSQPELYKKFGVSLWAPDAREAVLAADRHFKRT